MFGRKPVLALLGGLAFAAAGCRNCGDRCGWFASRACDPCRQIGRSAPTTDCCVSPIAGMPVSNVTGEPAPGILLPGSGIPMLPGPGGPSELPMPQPNLIPPAGVPGVPYAPPSVAPGEGSASTLPPPRYGVPVSDKK